MLPDNLYQEAFKIERCGAPRGSLGIKVLISIHPNRKLTTEELEIVAKHTEKMMGELDTHLALKDPKGIEESVSWLKELRSCFGDALLYAQRVPNGYCSGSCCVNRPWLVVTTPVGKIVIGPRKRVISISWEGSQIDKSAAELFPNEDVTKEGKCIHAWTLEKAREYVSVLLAQKVGNGPLSHSNAV